ncbi:MAG: 4'-phosphopantetheinyl transferase superfamily protein [Candidatus Altimarinota bacterium]
MLQIIHTSEKNFQEAIQTLPETYKNSLITKKTYKESLIGRYFIYKNTGYLPKINQIGTPIFEKDNFWSISHKENIVFIGRNQKEIGVDIEILKTRSKEVFSIHNETEYTMIGGRNFLHFYILWTLKESIIKVFVSSIDLLPDIKINTFLQEEKNINALIFGYHFIGTFQNIGWKGSIGVKDNLIYAFCEKI